MNISAELKPTETSNYYEMTINGLKLGTWERSQIRQLIEDFDNVIHH